MISRSLHINNKIATHGLLLRFDCVAITVGSLCGDSNSMVPGALSIAPHRPIEPLTVKSLSIRYMGRGRNSGIGVFYSAVLIDLQPTPKPFPRVPASKCGIYAAHSVQIYRI